MHTHSWYDMKKRPAEVEVEGACESRVAVPVKGLPTLPNVPVRNNPDTNPNRRRPRKSSHRSIRTLPDSPSRSIVIASPGRWVVRESSLRTIGDKMMHGPPEIVEKAAVGTGSMQHMTEQMPSTRNSFVGLIWYNMGNYEQTNYTKLAIKPSERPLEPQ